MGLLNRNTTNSLASFQGIICGTDNVEEKVKGLQIKEIEFNKINDTTWGMLVWLKYLDGNSLFLHHKQLVLNVMRWENIVSIVNARA
jgi:hypothetical protein